MTAKREYFCQRLNIIQTWHATEYEVNTQGGYEYLDGIGQEEKSDCSDR